VTLTRDDVSALRDAALDADAAAGDFLDLAEHAETLAVALVRAGDVKAAGEAERLAAECRRDAADKARLFAHASETAALIEDHLDSTEGFGPEDAVRWGMFWPTEDHRHDGE